MKVGALLRPVRQMRFHWCVPMFARLQGFCFIAALFLCCTPAAQSQKPAEPEPGAKLGKQLFSSNCAACHGIDGKGSERAPNVADSPEMKRRSSAEIFAIIHDGIPGTGMPAFHALSDAQIRALVAHLRGLQGPAESVTMTGDAKQGRSLFSGKGECSHCHMIAGEGGFVAQDLSEYARDHSGDQIKAAIVHPIEFGRRPVSVTLRNGQKIQGRLRNEDNFSIQLQSSDGAFHFVERSDVENIEAVASLRMPADYGSRLSATEINDLVTYLTEAAGVSKASNVKKAKRDYQDEP